MMAILINNVSSIYMLKNCHHKTNRFSRKASANAQLEKNSNSPGPRNLVKQICQAWPESETPYNKKDVFGENKVES